MLYNSERFYQNEMNHNLWSIIDDNSWQNFHMGSQFQKLPVLRMYPKCNRNHHRAKQSDLLKLEKYNILARVAPTKLSLPTFSSYHQLLGRLVVIFLSPTLSPTTGMVYPISLCRSSRSDKNMEQSNLTKSENQGKV